MYSFFSLQSNRVKRDRRMDEYEYDSWEEDYGYGQTKRSCRKRNKVNYKFDEYEEMISSAIKSHARSADSDPTLMPGTLPSVVL